MTFDIFVQGFKGGDAAPLHAAPLAGLLSAHGVHEGDVLVGLTFADGEADAYPSGDRPEDGLMVTHASGTAVWDFLAELATTCGATLLIPGCPTLVGSEEALAELPGEIRDDAIVITTGAEILAAVGAV